MMVWLREASLHHTVFPLCLPPCTLLSATVCTFVYGETATWNTEELVICLLLVYEVFYVILYQVCAKLLFASLSLGK